MNVLVGNIHKNKNILIWQTKKLEINSRGKIPTDIDGEIGEPLPAKLTVLAERLKIITNE
jgi:diacylglycerol kinase family enzyme